MANTYVQQRIHLVWSTKGRQDFLTAAHRAALWPFLGALIRNHGDVMFVAGGIEDHVHVYTEYPKTLSLSQFVNTVKSNSSKWLRDSYPDLQGFHWQGGYGGFSVSSKDDDALQEYIQNQEEYLKLLKRFRIPHDARYVFD